MSRLQALIPSVTDVNPPRRVIAPAGEAMDNIVLTFGKGSRAIKTVSLSGSSSLTAYMDKQQKETTEPDEGGAEEV